jgi:hypothetical protein
METTMDTSGNAKEPFPFDDNKIDFSKFKTELSATDIAKLTWPGSGTVIFPFGPIDALSPTKTVGKGRTNLTLISPTILQTDATTPYASFGAGTVSMHFEPIAYGITYTASYIMEFNIQTSGSATFTLDGYVGSGSLPNKGTKVINGAMTVQLVMQHVPPSQQTYGYLSQTSGASWNWYSTIIRFPPLVIER